MKKIVFSLTVVTIYILANLVLDEYIREYRSRFFIGEYDIFPLSETYDFINLGRSIGSDSFNWRVVEDYDGINMGMAGKPLSTDLLLLDFYENIINEESIIVIPITYSFFCSDETPYTPFETIYNYNLPLLGMVQTNATIEYLLKSIGLIELTTNRNNSIPLDYFPNVKYEPEICDDSNLSFYIDLIEKINLKNSNVILLITPHYMDFATNKESDGFIWFYQQINLLVDKTGIKFIDYSDLEELQDREFFNDFTHLNQIGRDQFTNLFVESLFKTN